MKIKLGNVNNLIGIYVSLIGGVMILVALPLSALFLVHIGTLVIFAGCAFHLINAVLCRANNSRYILLCVALMYYLLICAVVCSKEGNNKYVSVLTFSELPIFLTTLSYKADYKKFIRTAEFLFAGLSFYFFALSYTDYAYRYVGTYGIEYISDLTLGFNNPNETGMYLFACLIIVFNGIVFTKSKTIKAVFIVASLINIWLIIKTNSRICFIVALACVILAFIFRKKKIPKALKWIAFSFSVIYVPLTFLMGTLFSSWKILGDTIETGRIYVYENAINVFKESNYFFGEYKCLFNNFHNAPLSILVTSGLIGLSLFYVIIIRAFIVSERRQFSIWNKIAYLALLMIIVHSSVESAFLSSGSVYALLVSVIYIFAVYNNGNYDYSINNTNKVGFEEYGLLKDNTVDSCDNKD